MSKVYKFMLWSMDKEKKSNILIASGLYLVAFGWAVEASKLKELAYFIALYPIVKLLHLQSTCTSAGIKVSSLDSPM